MWNNVVSKSSPAGKEDLTTPVMQGFGHINSRLGRLDRRDSRTADERGGREKMLRNGCRFGAVRQYY